MTLRRSSEVDLYLPLPEARKRLHAEPALSSSRSHHKTNRFRHAGGAQTGAMVKPLLMALVVMGLIAGVAATIPHWARWSQAMNESFISFTATNGYIVRNVQVTGRDRVPAAELLSALSIERGMPLFAYDPQAAQTRVQDIKGVENVYIERRWPDTVFIRLTEAQPAVRWQKNEVVTLIDRKGRLVAQKPGEDVTSYPILIGDGVTDQIVSLFGLLQGEPDLIPQLKAATWVGNRRWDLTLRNNIVIKLPADNNALALSRLMKLAKEHDLFAKDIAVVDVRLPHQAVLRPTKRADLMIQRPDFSDPSDDPAKKNI